MYSEKIAVPQVPQKNGGKPTPVAKKATLRLIMLVRLIGLTATNCHRTLQLARNTVVDRRCGASSPLVDREPQATQQKASRRRQTMTSESN